MLGHNAIGDQALLSIAEGEATPYFIEIDDETEIDAINLVVIKPYIDPTVTG